jgi:hypothetical protein
MPFAGSGPVAGNGGWGQIEDSPDHLPLEWEKEMPHFQLWIANVERSFLEMHYLGRRRTASGGSAGTETFDSIACLFAKSFSINDANSTI